MNEVFSRNLYERQVCRRVVVVFLKMRWRFLENNLTYFISVRNFFNRNAGGKSFVAIGVSQIFFKQNELNLLI